MNRVLITGGTGFLGQDLAIKLKNNNTILLGGRNNGINRKAESFTGCESIPLSIESIESVRDVIRSFKPDIVIHAAATKFVDLSEKHPFECIDINIKGSQNVARVSIENNVKFVLGISTDKTAPPIGNIYGLSKSIMERMFCSLNSIANTKFSCVRFGNIAWSTGSIFPIWKQMTLKQKCIKSTGPKMRRFFFTVDEASALVIRALDNVNIIAGSVLTQKLKSTQIDQILDIWCQKFGVKWKTIERRLGDKDDEYLIGDLELKNTKKINLNNIEHYLITFNKYYENHIKESLSSLNAERLSGDEILNLINSEPTSES